MAPDFKNMSFNKLLLICGGIFVSLMVIAGLVISASAKPPPKVPAKRSVRFEAPESNIEMEQLRAEIKQLKERLESNNQSTQAAFNQTAAAIDKQNTNITTLQDNIQFTSSRVNNLEKQRIGARVNIIKPGDEENRPTRQARLAAGDRKTNAKNPVGLSGSGDYKVLASVGDRAWIRNGNEEFSVKAGQSVPINGQLVIKSISPNGQVLVDVESTR